MADISSNLPIRTLNDGISNPADVTVGVLDSGGALITPAKDASVTGLQVSQGTALSGTKGSLILASVLAGNASYTAAQVSPLVISTTGHLLVDVASSAGGLALDATIVAEQGPLSGAATATKSFIVGGVYTLARPTLTNTQQSAIQLDANGCVLVNIDESVTLTVQGTVTSNQGAPAAIGNAWYVRPTDGTNTMPMLDAVGRAGYVHITDGTNVMPTMDAISRAGFQKLTDGTTTAKVAAGSTLPAASDPALITTIRDTVNVNVVSSVASAPVADFDAASGVANAGIAAGASATHTYLVVATNYLVLENVHASASGKLKIEIKIGPVGSEVSKWVGFNSTANANIDIPCGGFKVPTGQNVLVIKTNEENAKAQNLYDTVVGENV